MISDFMTLFLSNSGGQDKPESPVAQPTRSEVSKLVFPEDSGYKFELEDMLRASAEVLGKGSFGTSYKASLEDGPTIAVKRLKLGNAATEIAVFNKLMETISNFRHENVATPRAYYSGMDEQLLVYDYYDRGSMLSLLHGMNLILCTCIISVSFNK